MVHQMSPIGRAVALAALVALAACGKERSPAPEQRTSTGTTTITGATTTACPMVVPGATTTVTDVDGGVAITIAAPAERVDEVRARAQRMAAAGGMSAACPCAEGAADGGAMMHGRGMMSGMHAGHAMGMRMMVPSDTRVEEVEGGVRMTLVARDAKDIPALREQARVHVEHMKAGGCPMM